MEQRNKKHRLYAPIDSFKQAVLDAIEKIEKVEISNAAKLLHPKLHRCFAECRHLFRILDVRGNNSVSQKDWLKFSLPQSSNSDFEETEESAFAILPSRKPSYINSHAQASHNSHLSNDKFKKIKKWEGDESIPILVGQSIKVIPKKSQKGRKRRQRRPSYEYERDKNKIKYSKGVMMKKMLIDDFRSIDINNNGDIDQFEWWIFYMTNEFDIYWTQKEKTYRITTFANVLRIIGPHVKLTSEWLQRKVLSKTIKSKKKYYILWWFFYDYFAGKVENASLIGNKAVSKLEVLSWFIALDFDPFQHSNNPSLPKNGSGPIQENVKGSITEKRGQLRSKSGFL